MAEALGKGANYDMNENAVYIFQFTTLYYQEFFDRKRFGKAPLSGVSAKSKCQRHVSQDLMALHAVGRAHSSLPPGDMNMIVKYLNFIIITFYL